MAYHSEWEPKSLQRLPRLCRLYACDLAGSSPTFTPLANSPPAHTGPHTLQTHQAHKGFNVHAILCLECSFPNIYQACSLNPSPTLGVNPPNTASLPPISLPYFSLCHFYHLTYLSSLLSITLISCELHEVRTLVSFCSLQYIPRAASDMEQAFNKYLLNEGSTMNGSAIL